MSLRIRKTPQVKKNATAKPTVMRRISPSTSKARAKS